MKMNALDIKERMFDDKGQIIGTWERFDRMNDITLANNLSDLSQEEQKKVPDEFLQRWDAYQLEQSSNDYWNNPLHC